MNLKESFRYQKFLDDLMGLAQLALSSRNHALKTTKLHRRSAANPEALDTTEEVAVDDPIQIGTVIEFAEFLIKEKEKLCMAIRRAKNDADIDIDALVETNKYRQSLSRYIEMMLAHKASARTERGTDYKFNAEGNQVSYVYDVEVVQMETYDRDKSRKTMKDILRDSEYVSRRIDEALITTLIEYNPPFKISDTLDEAMLKYLCFCPSD